MNSRTKILLEQQFDSMRGGGRPSDGKYYTEDTERVPSVTTVKDCLHPRGLMYWHWRNGKEGREFGDGGTPALEVGSLVHRKVEAWIHDEPQPHVPDKLALQVQSSFGAFKRWWEANQFEVVVTELPIVSEQWRFGGTPDAILRDSTGALCLGDWKSSKALYYDYLCQIAAYGLLWNERAPDDAQLTGGFHLVRFSKENGDMEHRHFPELDDGLELFLLLRRAYDLKRQLEQRVK